MITNNDNEPMPSGLLAWLLTKTQQLPLPLKGVSDELRLWLKQSISDWLQTQQMATQTELSEVKRQLAWAEQKINELEQRLTEQKTLQ